MRRYRWRKPGVETARRSLLIWNGGLQGDAVMVQSVWVPRFSMASRRVHNLEVASQRVRSARQGLARARVSPHATCHKVGPSLIVTAPRREKYDQGLSGPAFTLIKLAGCGVHTAAVSSRSRWLRAPATTLTEQAASASSAACFASRPSSTIRTISPTISTSWPSSAGCRTTRSISPRSSQPRPAAPGRPAPRAAARPCGGRPAPGSGAAGPATAPGRQFLLERRPARLELVQALLQAGHPVALGQGVDQPLELARHLGKLALLAGPARTGDRSVDNPAVMQVDPRKLDLSIPGERQYPVPKQPVSIDIAPTLRQE